MKKIKILLTDKTELLTEAECWTSKIPNIDNLNDAREKFVEVGDFKISKESILYIQEIQEDKEKK